MTQQQVMHEACIGSNKTVVDWSSFLRECYAVVLHNDRSPKIGGPGLTVEIDESHVRARKYNVGKVLRSQEVWVFGGICRETKECFVAPVLRRDEATLLPLIQNNIESGSHIIA
ncbi:Transposase: ISXO2-like domain-containing protein, partial [Dinothrombium tinctorium]